MTPAAGQASIDATLLAIAGATATRLTGMYGFNRSDRDDIRQELLLDGFVRLRNFDSAKSSHRTFVHQVVRHRVATLLASRQAACRDYRQCRDSLDGDLRFAANEAIPLSDTISAEDYETRIGRSPLSSRDRIELRIDVDSVISQLPPDLAAIAVLLKSVSIVEACSRLGLSRSTMYRRIADIRAIFEGANLHLHVSRPQAAPGRRRYRSKESVGAVAYAPCGRLMSRVPRANTGRRRL